VLVAAVVLAIWTVGIVVRLLYLQVVDRARLEARALDQQQAEQLTPAKRGEIVDRRGRLLAYSVDADTIYAVPAKIADPQAVAASLCDALEDCSDKDRQALIGRLGTKRPFAYVRRRATPEEARRVRALDLDAVGFLKESRRFYPNRELAAHLLGYVGMDNAGLGGLEATYDKVIRGDEGRTLVQVDAKGRVYARSDRTATTGGALELTIDEQLQYIVERELRAGVVDKRADGGAAVVMNPHTGEILALASWPTFNPNAYSDASADMRRNRAVQDLYEPGSTFKVVTVAAALEEDVLPIDAIIDTSPGVIRFGRRAIDEFQGHNYGALSFTDVIVRSSNVGAIKIGLRVGAERLGVYINRFGFGKPTSPDFPSESSGIVWNPAKLDDSALASVSMGYQVGVTPLQMAAAMSAVANGGTWIQPRVVRSATRDGVRQMIEPKVVRRAISPETALELVPILEAVVDRGTAKAARIPGYTVAGKTGTADKIVNKQYSNSQQNVSFLGFVPSRSPAITVIVMIDTPRVGSDTGGAVAAPVFARIAEASLRYLGVPSDLSPIRSVRADRTEPSHITPVATPVETSPAPAVRVEDPSVVPDVRGMGARDAVRRLARLGISVRSRGRGVVVDQAPAPGTPLERGLTCFLVFDRDPAPARAATGTQP
jgi:cell division protein FtsI/penicillin-binding protein 2